MPSDAPDSTILPADPWTPEVLRLRGLPPPRDVTASRWATFRADCARALRRAPELRAAGWELLDVFGLHIDAPGTRTASAGVAWLLNGREMGGVTPDAVEILLPAGGELRAYRMGERARWDAVLAWEVS